MIEKPTHTPEQPELEPEEELRPAEAEARRRIAAREALADQLIAELPTELSHERSPAEWNQVQIEVRDKLSAAFNRPYQLSEIANLIELVNKNPDQTAEGNPELTSNELFEKQHLVFLISHFISNNTQFGEEHREQELEELKKHDRHDLFNAAFLLQRKYHHLSLSAYKTVEGMAFETTNDQTVWLADETSFNRPVTLETEAGKLILKPGKKLLFGHFKGNGFVVHTTNEAAREMDPIMSLVLHAALVDFIAIIEDLKEDPERFAGGIVVGITPNPNLVDLCKKHLGFKQVVNIRKLVRDSIFNLNILRAMKLGVIQKVITNTILRGTISHKARPSEASEDGADSESHQSSLTIAVSIDELVSLEPRLLRLFATIDERVSRDHKELAEIFNQRPKVQYIQEKAWQRHQGTQ